MTILDLPGADTGYRLELNEAEHAEVAALGETAAALRPALIDDPAWLDQVRLLSCRLPVRLQAAIRRFRHDPGVDGTLRVGGLPLPAILPDTPAEYESVERVPSPAAAVQVMLGLQLGEVVAYRDENSGALVQNVVPVPGYEYGQCSAGSAAMLELHTENAFHPFRPDVIGLLCLREDHERRAGTMFASTRNALPRLDLLDRRVLHEARFVSTPTTSFTAGATARAHAVLGGSVDDPDLCVDFAVTTGVDIEARQVLGRLRRALLEVSEAIVLRPGELVFADNRVTVHGRTRFRPRYDGRDRWLHRVQVQLDHRRSRTHRDGGGAVLL